MGVDCGSFLNRCSEPRKPNPFFFFYMKQKLQIETPDKRYNVIAIGHASEVKQASDSISMINRNHRFRI